MIRLDRDIHWHDAPRGKHGRIPTFSNTAIQFCMTIKCMFNLALRQAVGMVQSLLKLAGLDWPTLDYSTVCRRQKSLQVVIPYRPNTRCAPAKCQLVLLQQGLDAFEQGGRITGSPLNEYNRQESATQL